MAKFGLAVWGITIYLWCNVGMGEQGWVHTLKEQRELHT